MSSSKKEFVERAHQTWDFGSLQPVSLVPNRQQINFDTSLSVFSVSTDDPNSSPAFQVQSNVNAAGPIAGGTVSLSGNGAMDATNIASLPVYHAGPMSAGTNAVASRSASEAQKSRNAAGEPTLKFYVQTGSYAPGTIHDFAPSGSNPTQADFTISYTVDSHGAVPSGMMWKIAVTGR